MNSQPLFFAFQYFIFYIFEAPSIFFGFACFFVLKKKTSILHEAEIEVDFNFLAFVRKTFIKRLYCGL